nr:uncharacterized protein LOC113819725 [Penaeus vannamei]
MAANFKVLTEDSQFQTELNQAGGKLVVADFTSARCLFYLVISLICFMPSTAIRSQHIKIVSEVVYMSGDLASNKEPIQAVLQECMWCRFAQVCSMEAVALSDTATLSATGQNGGAITNTFVPLVLQKRLTYVPARQSLDPDQDESDFGLTLKIFLLRYFVLHSAAPLQWPLLLCQSAAPVSIGALLCTKSLFPKISYLMLCSEDMGPQNHPGIIVFPWSIIYIKASLQGADPETLKARVSQHYGDGDNEEMEDSGVPGHIDLLPMVNKAGCECLNESDDHPFTQALNSAGGYLESDTDEQLILYLSFNQAVKLHSMRIKAPADCGPKTIKVFINQPHTIDFDTAESANPIQEITLSPKDLEGELITLKYVKLQNVMNFTIFIKDNQTEAETTQISYLQIIGSPVQTTKMADFKRVAGKKGESH